jgi:hypothetical protein
MVGHLDFSTIEGIGQSASVFFVSLLDLPTIRIP